MPHIGTRNSRKFIILLDLDSHVIVLVWTDMYRGSKCQPVSHFSTYLAEFMYLYAIV